MPPLPYQPAYAAIYATSEVKVMLVGFAAIGNTYTINRASDYEDQDDLESHSQVSYSQLGQIYNWS